MSWWLLTVAIGAAIVLPPANSGDSETLAAVREAAFREALRVVREHRPSVELSCLAVESSGDPPPALLERLQRGSRIQLHPYSVCVRDKLMPVEIGTRDGPKDLVALGPLTWKSKHRVEIPVSILGGSSMIIVTKDKRTWKAVCNGGIVG
jgi:hypothetical protein